LSVFGGGEPAAGADVLPVDNSAVAVAVVLLLPLPRDPDREADSASRIKES
jgi:hypothetical protein